MVSGRRLRVIELDHVNSNGRNETYDFANFISTPFHTIYQGWQSSQNKEKFFTNLYKLTLEL